MQMLEHNKINTGPKVKVFFWWRVMHNYVLVKANPMERHIETQGTCPDCGIQDETVYHALIACTFATMFWQSLYELCNIKLPKLHPATWCFDLLDNSFCLCPPFYVECGQFGQCTVKGAMGKQK
jgi:hypothetical protein